MGVAFAEVSPDFCFCVNTRGHRCAFLLPPVGFAIITLVVCMLAAWEWGQLSGFAARSQRVWLAVLCGLLLALMLFLLPEYHHNIRQPLVEMSLWASLGWWVVALLLVLFYPGSAAIWRNSKTLRLIFGLLTIVPFFWGMLALRAWHYDENHYSGAIWLLYVMILVWGADSGAYMFGKLFGKHKLAPKVSRVNLARVYRRACYGCRDLMGLRYVGESECCACYLADLLCGGGSGFCTGRPHREYV